MFMSVKVRTNACPCLDGHTFATQREYADDQATGAREAVVRNEGLEKGDAPTLLPRPSEKWAGI